MPRNAEKAITPDFYRYTPNTGRSSYGSTYIRRPDNRRHRRSLLVSDQRGNIARLDRQVAAVEREMAAKREEVRRAELALQGRQQEKVRKREANMERHE